MALDGRRGGRREASFGRLWRLVESGSECNLFARDCVVWVWDGSTVPFEDDEIYRKHRTDLIHYASSLVGPDRAEDVLSTVMVKVLDGGGLARLDDPRPYLFRAVLNQARSVLRRSRKPALPPSAVEMAQPDVDLLDAVNRLPARQRAAIYLVYWEGLTIHEASDLMGLSDGTVKRYLHLARRRLKGALL